MHTGVNSEEFLRAVRPALASGDPCVLAEVVSQRWSVPELCSLIDHPDANVRRVVAVILGLVGDIRIAGCLTRALMDPDQQVNQMAEHALWSVWFRACKPSAAESFRRGMAALADEDYAQAVVCLERTRQLDPAFAEASHQCGTAYYLLNNWSAAIECFLKALERVPMHFGALAGLGHCYMEINQWDLALQCYRRALRINPGMSAVAQTIRELDERIRHRNDSSGMFQSREISV